MKLISRLMFDVPYLLMAAALCWARYKGYCGTCKKEEIIPDIIQIMSIAVMSVILIGVLPMVQLIFFAAITMMIRAGVDNMKEKPGGEKDCGPNCQDPWK